MVEAGSELTSAFLAEDLADEIVLYRSPKILGSGKDLFSLPENRTALTDPPLWIPVFSEIFEHDIKTVFRKDRKDLPFSYIRWTHENRCGVGSTRTIL